MEPRIGTMKTITEKLTAKLLAQLEEDGQPGTDVWDSELAGYHVRVGSRGIAFRVSYRNLSRRRRVITLGQHGELTSSQARSRARETLALIAQGIDPRQEIEEARAEKIRQKEHTIGGYLEGDYSHHLRRLKSGEETKRGIKTYFSKLLDRPLVSLTGRDIEAWQIDMEAGALSVSGNNSLSFGTVKRAYSTLQAMLNHAVKRKVIEENPLAGVSLQKPVITNNDDEEEEDDGRRYLTADEVNGFFKGLDAYQEYKRFQRRNSRAHGKSHLSDLNEVKFVDHVVPWLLTAYYTGFRPGDITGLKWSHVNFNFKYIRKVIEKTAHHSSDPKTFPLSDKALSVLKEWWAQQGKPSSGYVFSYRSSGKRMSKTALRNPWRRVKHFGGLPETLVLYTLRHNFASQMVMAGVDLLTVSKLMAHSSIETTIKYYAHLQPDHKRKAVQLFADLATAEEPHQDEAERTAT